MRTPSKYYKGLDSPTKGMLKKYFIAKLKDFGVEVKYNSLGNYLNSGVIDTNPYYLAVLKDFDMMLQNDPHGLIVFCGLANAPKAVNFGYAELQPTEDPMRKYEREMAENVKKAEKNFKQNYHISPNQLSLPNL